VHEDCEVKYRIEDEDLKEQQGVHNKEGELFEKVKSYFELRQYLKDEQAQDKIQRMIDKGKKSEKYVDGKKWRDLNSLQKMLDNALKIHSAQNYATEKQKFGRQIPEDEKAVPVELDLEDMHNVQEQLKAMLDEQYPDQDELANIKKINDRDNKTKKEKKEPIERIKTELSFEEYQKQLQTKMENEFAKQSARYSLPPEKFENPAPETPAERYKNTLEKHFEVSPISGLPVDIKDESFHFGEEMDPYGTLINIESEPALADTSTIDTDSKYDQQGSEFSSYMELRKSTLDDSNQSNESISSTSPGQSENSKKTSQVISENSGTSDGTRHREISVAFGRTRSLNMPTEVKKFLEKHSQQEFTDENIDTIISDVENIASIEENVPIKVKQRKTVSFEPRQSSKDIMLELRPKKHEAKKKDLTKKQTALLKKFEKQANMYGNLRKTRRKKLNEVMKKLRNQQTRRTMTVQYDTKRLSKEELAALRKKTEERANYILQERKMIPYLANYWGITYEQLSDLEVGENIDLSALEELITRLEQESEKNKRLVHKN
jgi:hypothetical protein